MMTTDVQGQGQGQGQGTVTPAAKPERQPRQSYRTFRSITTRWMDNDMYAHVNNVVYYSFFDTVVNGYLLDKKLLDPQTSEVIGLVVETACQYFAPVSFPEVVQAGLRVARMGTSSVRYEVGLFSGESTLAAAQGHFVHVYVNRATRKPVPIPAPLRVVLAEIATG